MIKPDDPRQLALDIMLRSICSVQVGAAIADSSGKIISWGWNNVGSGWGIHAEAHAIRRANKDRLEGSTIFVSSQRARNAKTINSRPCDACSDLIYKWKMKYVFRAPTGLWLGTGA